MIVRTLRAVLPVAMVASAVLGVAQERTNRDQSHYTELHDPGFPIKSGLTSSPPPGPLSATTTSSWASSSAPKPAPTR